MKERILKTSSLQEENKILHTQNNDKKEELETKTARIKHLEMLIEKKSEKEIKSDEKSLANELDLIDKQEMMNLKKELGFLKISVEKMKKQKGKREALNKHLNELSDKRIQEFETLKQSIKQLERRRTQCRFGWGCKRAFCKYEHSYLYKIINQKREVKFETSVLKSKDDLEHHIKSGQKKKVVGSKEKRYSCEICSKVFHKCSQLRKHKRRDCNKEITCLKCGKYFVVKGELELHMSSDHVINKLSDKQTEKELHNSFDSILSGGGQVNVDCRFSPLLVVESTVFFNKSCRFVDSFFLPKKL